MLSFREGCMIKINTNIFIYFSYTRWSAPLITIYWQFICIVMFIKYQIVLSLNTVDFCLYLTDELTSFGLKSHEGMLNILWEVVKDSKNNVILWIVKIIINFEGLNAVSEVEVSRVLWAKVIKNKLMLFN